MDRDIPRLTVGNGTSTLYVTGSSHIRIPDQHQTQTLMLLGPVSSAPSPDPANLLARFGRG